MRFPLVRGIIKRRMLINFRVDASVMQRFLPAPFRPKLHQGHAIAGICLIRLEEIRPGGLPALLGVSSENAAHRIAVEWDEPSGEPAKASSSRAVIPALDSFNFVADASSQASTIRQSFASWMMAPTSNLPCGLMTRLFLFAFADLIRTIYPSHHALPRSLILPASLNAVPSAIQRPAMLDVSTACD